jgi:RNA polymerase sigma factor (sigma-70 family)
MLHDLRRSSLRPEESGPTDGELLECFIGRRDQAAFGTLLQRHGPMVLGVCRRVLRNEADAEDAFQATFLVLVRKAASIRPRGMVGSWLSGVAHRAALKAKAMSTKRLAKERAAATRTEKQVVADTWEHLRTHLDQELQALPDKYRAAIVLCDLEGKAIREAARQLGCPPGTIGTRLPRGRSLLARRLARHGGALSASALAVALSQDVISASVPAALAVSTGKAAALFAAGQVATGGIVSAKVATLTEGVLITMLLDRLKIAMAVVLGLVVVGAGLGLFSYTLAAAEPTPPRPKAMRVAHTDASKKNTPKEKAAQDAEQLKQKEAAKLKGTWKAVAAEIAGQAQVLPEDAANAHVWDILDGKITRQQSKDKKGMEEEVVPFTIDPSQKPAHIDFAIEVAGIKGVLKGIYKLDGDELTVCLFGADGGRPTEFGSGDFSKGEKGGQTLFKFKREKP